MDSERVFITLSAQNASYLEDLAQIGIHGVTPSEVAKHFVENGIERMVREGFLKLKPVQKAGRRQRRVPKLVTV